MLKNIISYIFIYIFLVGCDLNPIDSSEDCNHCMLELSSDLMVDKNGYHHLEWIEGYQQTFTRINAYVGHTWQYVGWLSDTQFCFEWNGTVQCDDVINGSSYSGDDGIAESVLGIHQEHIGDTITVYCGYYEMGIQYLDSIGVIIDE